MILILIAKQAVLREVERECRGKERRGVVEGGTRDGEGERERGVGGDRGRGRR